MLNTGHRDHVCMEASAAPASNDREHGSNKRQRTVAPQGATPDITEGDSARRVEETIIQGSQSPPVNSQAMASAGNRYGDIGQGHPTGGLCGGPSAGNCLGYASLLAFLRSYGSGASSQSRENRNTKPMDQDTPPQSPGNQNTRQEGPNEPNAPPETPEDPAGHPAPQPDIMTMLQNTLSQGFTMLRDQLVMDRQQQQASSTAAAAASPGGTTAGPQATPSRDRRRRPPEKNELAKKVRECMQHYLGGPGREYEVKVREEDAKRYEEVWRSSAGTTPASGLDQFSVFFQGPPASAWNKSAAHVLTQHIMTNVYKYADNDYENRKIIETACLAHIRIMCSNYRSRLKPQTVQTQKQQDGNKASRKSNASIFSSKIEYEF
ncbi:uncharacterized protein ARMOST_15246 [Armillaria ostoyae]|uniref:Uncharacterized protein n=1 Tax=Armillaria ostoyae TaxID=47428 RepID=A0A284RT19_ARMOS|nr:uncharacterized protein ARMOST_15246 [Armillaria ostoyae]